MDAVYPWNLESFARCFAVLLGIVAVIAFPFLASGVPSFGGVPTENESFSVGLGMFVPENAYPWIAAAGALAFLLNYRRIALAALAVVGLHWVVVPVIQPLFITLPSVTRFMIKILAAFAIVISLIGIFFLLIKIFFGKRVHDHVVGDIISNYTIKIIDALFSGFRWIIVVLPSRIINAVFRR